MTAREFKIIREAAGLSMTDLAALLRISTPHLLPRYEHNELPVSGPISLLMELLRDGRLN